MRKELNVSQKELAELIGSKQQAISRIEKKEQNLSTKIGDGSEYEPKQYKPIRNRRERSGLCNTYKICGLL